MENAVVDTVAELQTAVDAARKMIENDLWSCGSAQVIELLARVHRVRAQVESIELDLVREVEVRGIAAEVGALDTRTYLMGAFTMTPAEAATTVKLAKAFGSRLADTGHALAEGHICRERAKAITEVLTSLPTTVTAEQLQDCQDILLESSTKLHAGDIRRFKPVLEHYLDPDGVEPREQAAKRKRSAFLRPNGDGTTTLKWTDTDEQMARLQAALEPLSAPQPGIDGEPDPRDASLRRADALAELVDRLLRHGDLPTSHGVRPHLTLTVTEATMFDGKGFGVSATGEHLSAATVRRISCDAIITAIRIDTNGVPLSMGRSRRTVTPQQWQALVVRDMGCVFPNCDRPAAWCDAHHVRHWIDLGPTDLDNMVLVCGRHHEAIHHDGWDVEIAADGRPDLRPPPWIDPERRPRRNPYWQTQAEFHLR